MLFFRRRHTKHRAQFRGHELGQKALTVSQLSTLVASPCHETDRGEERCTVQFRVRFAHSAAEEERGRERNSSPHVARDKAAFVTTAPGEQPAEKDCRQRGEGSQRQNEASGSLQVFSVAKEACAFERRDQQDQPDRKMHN